MIKIINKKQGFIIPLIIAIVAILAISGVVYLAPEKKVEAPVVSAPVDTSDWRTYKNEKHGFEFKYPSNWSKQNIGVDGGDDPYRFGIFQVDDQSPNTPKDGLYGPSISFWVFNLTDASGDTKTAKDEIVKDVVEDGYVYGWTKVDGFEALRAEKNFKSGKQDNTAIDYYIFKGNKLYKLDFNHNNNNPTLDKYLSQFETLVSTFSFIKPVTATTTQPVACTMDAMMCPDGSYVGRSGPKCEFLCPAIPILQYDIPIIFSPNGGEVLKIGDTQSISWASLYTNYSPFVSITIFANYSGCFNLKQEMTCLPVMDPIFILASSTPNVGTYKWEVGTFSTSQYGNSIREGKYYLKICDSINKNICDVSDNLFEIK